MGIAGSDYPRQGRIGNRISASPKAAETAMSTGC